MARGRILPFRIPFFRIFYSTTYTLLYALTLLLLAITPASMIYTTIEARAFQYIFMLGGIYILVALLAVFIYSSRLYTNRTVLAAVGKSYIPVEDGEVGRKVRKMIVKQMERSAVVAFEARPRDVVGEILQAEQDGVLPAETRSVGHNDYTVGRIIPIDPSAPPWKIVRHEGWSSPSHRDGNEYPDVQFATVILELPNLVEARAVSLAAAEGQEVDMVVADVLRRTIGMGLREYITQLGYLGLINPLDLGQTFVRQYEHARFCGRPISELEFANLMSTFSELLAGMTELRPEIVEQIHTQTAQAEDAASSIDEADGEYPAQPKFPRQDSTPRYMTPQPKRDYSLNSSTTSVLSPVTAREQLSRTATPYLGFENISDASLGSVLRRRPTAEYHAGSGDMPPNASSSSLASSNAAQEDRESDAGSVIRHDYG
jgi:hypothetical protein